jgi:DNA-binding transcriptional ArsR family regulator
MKVAGNGTRRLDTVVAKALANPLRQRILLELERGPASPSSLARKLGRPLNLISYHTGVLAEAGCVELAYEQPVRGAIEHFYRPTERAFLDDEAFSQLPVGLRRRLVGQTIELIFDDTREAAEAGGFDDGEVHVSRTLLELDDEGYEDLTTLLAETLDRALEIHAASAGRAHANRRFTELGILHFVRKV